MGRPPKPIEQKRRLGNPGRRDLPVPLYEIEPVVKIPTAPRGLQASGRRFWKDTWTAGSAWLSPRLDYAVVELAARSFDEVRAYRDILAKGSLLQEPITTASGKVVGTRFVPNPAEMMLRRAERQLERWLVELAIPPIARARLGLVQVKAQSKLEALMAGGSRERAIDDDEDDVVDAEVVE